MSLPSLFSQMAANGTSASVAILPLAATTAQLAPPSVDPWGFAVPIITAAAGAITSVGFPQYRSLALRGKLFAIGLGMTFALIMAPVFAPWILGIANRSGANLAYLEGRAIVFYLTGLLGYSAPPMILKAFARKFESTLAGLIKDHVVEQQVADRAGRREPPEENA